MMSQIDNKQMQDDWCFVLQQAKNGDKKAIEIYRIYNYLRSQILESFRELKTCFPSYRFVYWNRINALQDEKAFLLKKYKVSRKRAKAYLDNLNRKRKE